MSDLDWDDDKPAGGAEPAQPATAPAEPAADVKQGEKIADKVANKMLGDLGMGKKEEPARRVYNPSGDGYYQGGYGRSYGNGYGYGYGQGSFDDLDDFGYTRPQQTNVRQGPGMRYGNGQGNFKGSAWGGSPAGKYKPKKFSDVITYIDALGLSTTDMFFDGFMEKFLEDNFMMGKFLGAMQVWYGQPKKRSIADDPDLGMPE